MNNFIRDLKFAARLFVKRKLVTSIVVVTLAMGLGVTSTIVSLVGTVLVAPFPSVSDPRRVVWMFNTRGQVDRSRDDVSVVDYLRWKQELRAVDSLAAFCGIGHIVEGRGEPETVKAFAVTTNYFQMLGTRMAAGRDFGAEEDTPGHEHVAILAHTYAEQRFGSAEAAIGQTLFLSGTTHTIIGILPTSFAFPQAFRIFTPLVLTPKMRASREPTIVAVGRLRAGLTTENANAELAAISQRLAEEFPDTHKGTSAVAMTLDNVFIGSGGRAISLLTILAAVLTLAVASVNVGNILLAQGASRRAEIAVRAALGASRGRLIAQLLTECLLLCAAGGALGALVSSWGLNLFMASMPERIADRMKLYWDLRFDQRWTAVVVGLTIFTTAVAGLLPAWRQSATRLTEAFKEQGNHATPGRSHRRLLKVLVTGQVAIALALLSGALWSLIHLARIERTKLGIDPSGVLIGSISRERSLSVGGKEQDRTLESVSFFAELRRRLRAMPGVTSVALTSRAPLERGLEELKVAVPGRPPAPAGQPLWTATTSIEGDYFATLHIKMLEGRVFTEQDGAGAPPVAVLSARAAGLVFPGERALGKTLLLDEKTPATVVGLVDDVVAYHHEEVGMIYLPLAQRPSATADLLLRGAGDVRQFERPMRDAVHALDRHQAVADVMPLAMRVEEFLWTPRTMVRLVAIPGTLAMLLALLGIYGVAAYSANQRQSELGIRAALGASPRALVALVMREAVWIGSVGTGIGLTLSILLVSALPRAGGEQDLSIPQTIGLALALFAVVLFASYGPAQRVSKVSPSWAIRSG